MVLFNRGRNFGGQLASSVVDYVIIIAYVILTMERIGSKDPPGLREGPSGKLPPK